MLWLIPAILAGLLWAISNIGDKYIVSQKIKNPFVYLILLGLFGLISIIFLPFTSFENFSLQIGLLLVLASALYFVASVPYLKALQLEEVSRVNIWWSLIPIFSFVIGFAGGLEKFSFNELFAFIFLVTGSFIASLHSDSKKVYFSKAVGYMIPAGIFLQFMVIYCIL